MSSTGQEPSMLSLEDLDMVFEVVSAHAEQLRATVEFERRYNHDLAERLDVAVVESWNRLEGRVAEVREAAGGQRPTRFHPEPTWRLTGISVEHDGDVVARYDAGGRSVSYSLSNATPDSPARPTAPGYQRLLHDVRAFAAELQTRGTTEAVLQSHHLRSAAKNLEAQLDRVDTEPATAARPIAVDIETDAAAPLRTEPPSPPGQQLTDELADDLYQTLRALSVYPDHVDEPDVSPGAEWSPDVEDPGRSIGD